MLSRSLSLELSRRLAALCIVELAAAQIPLQDMLGEADHWSAAAHAFSADAELRVNALGVLAWLGDGSCSRSGPYRTAVRKVLVWLMAQQDEKGRFALRADPDWLLDHAMATYAVLENLRLTEYSLEKSWSPVLAAAAVLTAEVPRVRPAPDFELRLWATMVGRSLLAAGTRLSLREDRVELGTRVTDAAAALQRVLAGIEAGDRTGQSPRERAAAVLLADLRGQVAELVPFPEQPMLDPLHAFYVAVAHWRRGPAECRSIQKAIEKHVVREQRSHTDVEVSGTWDPVGAWGERHGRIGATAAATLILEIYYRYCRLEVAGDK